MEQPEFDFTGSSNTEVIAPFSGLQQETQVCNTAPAWHEVPAARFLSWSDAMQRAYCRNRDLDSAKHAENAEWRQFYTQRAESYV